MRSCGHAVMREAARERGRAGREAAQGERPRREGGLKTGPASFSPSFFSPAWDLTSGGKMVALMSSRRNTSVIACQCQAQGGEGTGRGGTAAKQHATTMKARVIYNAHEILVSFLSLSDMTPGPLDHLFAN